MRPRALRATVLIYEVRNFQRRITIPLVMSKPHLNYHFTAGWSELDQCYVGRCNHSDHWHRVFKASTQLAAFFGIGQLVERVEAAEEESCRILLS